LLAEALRLCGWRPVTVRWSDPDVDWSSFAAVVVRATWDYHLHPRAFSAWLDRLTALGVITVNALPLLRWNMHKFYLRDLARADVPIVPTHFAAAGEMIEPAALTARFNADRLVVKPAVSASAYQLRLLDNAAATAPWTVIEDTLVQPFLPNMASHGEWSLVFVNGGFSHAVVKRAQAGDFRVQSDFGGQVTVAAPPWDLLGFGKRACAALPDAAVFARVDAVNTETGFRLMELEVIEPELFFMQVPAAADRLATALAETCASIRA